MLNTLRKLTALFCALTFVVCAFLSSTYAWESEQQVINDLSGKKTRLVTTELLKLEKQEDTSAVDIPVSGTVFYLFSETGTQIGGRYLTDKDGKISVELGAGKYYFEEAVPSVGYTYDTDSNGEKITRYPFIISEDDEKITVKAYNIRLKGSLSISKTVQNTNNTPLSEIQKKIGFVFTVTFSDSKSYAYRIDNGEEKILKSGESLRLCHAQTAVFQNIPVGTQYTVTEEITEGYVCTSTGNQGSITPSGATASFINSFDSDKLGSLTVKKQVLGTYADLGKRFVFNLKIGDITEIFTLKHGESKTFDNIPIGTEYIVTEDDYSAEGYKATVREYKGKIANSENVTLPFVNIHKYSSDDKTGWLKVSKIVKGESTPTDKMFTFTVEFTGNNAPKNQVFTLKSGESKFFENIPDGVTYTVTETDSAGYMPVIESSNGIIAGACASEVQFINIVPDIPPEKEEVTITVSKKIDGELSDSHKELEFAFVLIVDGRKTEFKLKANESRTFDICKGSVYELRELDYSKQGFSQCVTNGFGVADKQPINITVTNTFIGTPQIEIDGTKRWEMGKYTDVKLPESITIRLKNRDLIVEEKTIKPDEKGDWKYSFIAPKYNADGSVAEYKVEELEITSYRTTYDGFNITNTYVPPIEVEIPKIIKQIEGEDAPNSVFEFIFRSNLGLIMPENSEGNKKIVTITGAGEVDLGKLIFTEAGEYTYTVTEINTGEEGWIYDKSIYSLTFKVTEKDNELFCEPTIYRDNEKTEKIEFVNSYDKTLLDENIVISGKKNWNHGNNPENLQPEYIIVEIYADGELVVQRQITVKDNWMYSFELPRFATDGHKIVYTVNEAPVADYKATVDGYDITNTYIGSPSTPDTPQYPPVSDAPTQTGDSNNLSLYFALMIISLLGFFASTLIGKNSIIHKCNKL